MRVKLLCTRADRKRRYEIGEEIDLPDAEAIRLIEDKQAEPVRTTQTELAIGPQGERATQRRQKPLRNDQRGDAK